MKPKIVVIGSSNTDMVVYVTHLPSAGETVLGHQFESSRGGKGANQAISAARLGAEVCFVTRLGRDNFGEESFKCYVQEGLDTDFIVWDEKEPSGVALIMVERSGENSIAVASGANAHLSPQDVEAAASAIRSASCILLQLEIPLETVEAAVNLASKSGVRIILNPAPAVQLPASLLKKVDILTPNEKEADLLAAGYTSAHVGDVAGFLYQQSGVRNLVITMGAKGSVICGSSNAFVPGFPIQAIDTTGAGDAFNGGLAVGLARGDDLITAVRYANAVGALSTTQSGAQSSLPSASQVENFLNQSSAGVPSRLKHHKL